MRRDIPQLSSKTYRIAHRVIKGGNMDFELKPRTEAGMAFVMLAEQHAEEFAAR